MRLAREAGGDRDLGQRIAAVEDAGEGVAQPELAAKAVNGEAGGRAEHAAGVKHRVARGVGELAQRGRLGEPRAHSVGDRGAEVAIGGGCGPRALATTSADGGTTSAGAAMRAVVELAAHAFMAVPGRRAVRG